MRKHLATMDMTAADAKIYMAYMENVQREVRELRVILESIEAKNKERVWLKNQSSGDLDDTKLIEGLTGDHNIYKLRGDQDPEMGFQQKPKKMYFVFDLSASMFRFNNHDRRLERSMEVALSKSTAHVLSPVSSSIFYFISNNLIDSRCISDYGVIPQF